MTQPIQWRIAVLVMSLAPLSASQASEVVAPDQTQIQALRREVAWGTVLMRHLKSCDASRASAIQAEWAQQQALWTSRAAMLDLPADEVDQIHQQSLAAAKKEWEEASTQKRASLCQELLDNTHPTPSSAAQKD